MISPRYAPIRRAAVAWVCLAVPLCACEQVADADPSSSGTGSDTGPSDEVDCTPNDTDGRTACSISECSASEYCRDDFTCLPGCESTLNCAQGQWCDKRQPQMNDDGSTVGVCRSTDEPVCTGDGSAGSGPTSDTSSDTTTTGTVGEACSDVEGNYRVSLDDGAPDICESFVQDGDMCSVAQSNCELTWGCDSPLAQILAPGRLDDQDVYEVSGSLMGIAYECEFEFTPGFDGFFSWSCSLSMDGQAIVCEGFGSKQ